MAKQVFFRRKKSCPFSGEDALKIDYKDVKDIKIQFNNGKEIVVTNKDYGIEYTPLQNGINRISCDFGEIVNINDLESISIGDQIINMK